MTREGFQSFLIRITSRSDLVLAALLIVVIFMLLIPLPTELIDALIGFNIGVAVILMMVAIYIKSPTAFSAFPSVLLVTTLWRLAIGISTTRLILLQADAGRIVETFGNFVVAGNLVVGLVIFLIITIVQFVVITKGAERVAEVAARFSLDAMPGKQMSIDSDMRAGLIDMEQARARRGMLEKESQLYGAMDGAMKFVKGDAIAGIIIITINLIGGISIGTLQRGLSVDEAIHTYSILTIGDGLVQQIPALLIAMTAGIIVTRVGSEESVNLGSDISQQMTAQPRALIVGAFILCGFSLIPGMPTVTFLLLGAVLGGIGYWRVRKEKAANLQQANAGRPSAMAPAVAPGGSSAPKPSGGGGSQGDEEFSLTVPLMLDVAADVQQSISAGELNEELIRIRRALYIDLGVPFPGIHLRFNESLTGGKYDIMMYEVPVSEGQIRPDYLFVKESKDNLEIIGVPYEDGKKFLPDLETLWVPAAHREALSASGIAFMDTPRLLTYHLSFILKRYSEDFIGIQETQFLLAHMEKQAPDLVKEVQRILPIQNITDVFRRLVSEEISIRNLRAILHSLIEWGQKEKDVVVLTEYVRIGSKRYISNKYSSGQNVLPAYLFTPEIEDEVRNSIRQTSAGSYLALDPNKARQLLANIREAIGDLDKHAQRPVLLTSMDVRRYMRKLIEAEFYQIPVLSYQELTQDITVQPLKRIDL